jgi:hypothetical protein
MNEHIKRALESNARVSSTAMGLVEMPPTVVVERAERALAAVAGLPVDHARRALKAALDAVETAAYVPVDVVRTTTVVSTSDRVTS